MAPLVGVRLLDGHSLYVGVNYGEVRRHRAPGYRLNSTSKVVLPTVNLGPPNWIKSRTFHIRFAVMV